MFYFLKVCSSCCCQDTTTIILDPEFSSEEVAASLENLHKTGNPDPLAFVLGLLGDEQGGVNDEEGGHLENLGVDIESGKVFFNENQFTLSHNAKHPEKRQMKTSCDSKLDPSFTKD